MGLCIWFSVWFAHLFLSMLFAPPRPRPLLLPPHPNPPYVLPFLCIDLLRRLKNHQQTHKITSLWYGEAYEYERATGFRTVFMNRTRSQWVYLSFKPTSHTSNTHFHSSFVHSYPLSHRSTPHSTEAFCFCHTYWKSYAVAYGEFQSSFSKKPNRFYGLASFNSKRVWKNVYSYTNTNL